MLRNSSALNSHLVPFKLFVYHGHSTEQHDRRAKPAVGPLPSFLLTQQYPRIERIAPAPRVQAPRQRSCRMHSSPEQIRGMRNNTPEQRGYLSKTLMIPGWRIRRALPSPCGEANGLTTRQDPIKIGRLSENGSRISATIMLQPRPEGIASSTPSRLIIFRVRRLRLDKGLICLDSSRLAIGGCLHASGTRVG